MAGEEPKLTVELQKELDGLRESYLATTPADVTETMQRATEQLLVSGITERALKVGARAPDFSLPNAVGREIRLSTTLSRGVAVITFYRGAW